LVTSTGEARSVATISALTARPVGSNGVAGLEDDAGCAVAGWLDATADPAVEAVAAAVGLGRTEGPEDAQAMTTSAAEIMSAIVRLSTLTFIDRC
jgi:hypothetical protein